jgi:hypothetical protein
MYNIIERMKTAVLLVAAMVAALQTAVGSQADKLPPISYVCPMVQDAEVIEDKTGKCPKCGMELVPIRLDSVWTCPVHSVIKESKPGQCPIDHRDLVQVTMQLSWTCPGRPDSNSPGTCPDGTARAKKYSPRAHGNHNPQHGGQFFMAPDNWHHLEGTLPRAGVFRLYLYDDYTKPLPRDQVQKTTARLVLNETFDQSTKTSKEVSAVRLVPAQNGRYLEARIGQAALPAQMTAKIKFQPAAAEHRFDFTFAEYSKEPIAPTTNTTARAAAATPPQPPAAAAPTPAASAAPAASSSSAAAAPAGVDPGLVPLPIPDSVPEILTQLAQRTEQVRRFIDQGSFASVYVPAFQAKDLALALDQRTKDLSSDRRRAADPAIKQLVRSAWLLDAFGDLGNREHIAEAFEQFAAAAKEIQTVFAGPQ